jgi:hypothetical protein
MLSQHLQVCHHRQALAAVCYSLLSAATAAEWQNAEEAYQHRRLQSAHKSMSQSVLALTLGLRPVVRLR